MNHHDKNLPPFASLRDGDRITIVGTVRRDPASPATLVEVLLYNDILNLASDEYAEVAIRVERATWTEVTE